MGHTPVLLVDSVLPAPAVAAWMRQQLAAIDPTVPITVETMRRAVGNLAERPRFEAALVALFAICGLLLSAIGLYGVLAFLASQRTQEIGIRMALGATRLDALRLVAGEGLRLTLLGSLAGLAAAFGSVRLIRSLLYQVAPYDPSLYIAAVAVLALVAMAATLIPARRAASVEPMTALRHE
jgi:ABC-type antimicrobial peptide transport system permease subunit